MARIGRVVFLGTGGFGVPLLRRLPELVDDVLVVTAPDRPAGRHLQLRPSPIASESRSLQLATVAPDRLRSPEAVEAIRSFAPDGLLLAAYGQLVPTSLLAVAPRLPLNVHPSLLPRHRGAAPIQATILAGDERTGVTLMEMTPELDAGPILAQWEVALTGREEAAELEARLAALAAAEVPALLGAWAAGPLSGLPQDPSRATMTHPLTREDGRIHWSESAAAIDRQVRALQPWPGAWTTVAGRRLHVRKARPAKSAEPIETDRADAPPGSLLPGTPPRVGCGSGALVLEVVQPEGRPAMPADAWLRGLPTTTIQLGDA